MVMREKRTGLLWDANVDIVLTLCCIHVGRCRIVTLIE